MATKIANQKGKKSRNDPVTAPARRAWVKKSLGALGVLGLSGVAACQTKREVTAPEPNPWRKERVFIFNRRVYDGDKEIKYKWVVMPGEKVVTPNQLVTWRAFLPPGHKVTIELPEGVFTEPERTFSIDQNAAVKQARVASDAKPGYYPYTVEVEDDKGAKTLAVGDSSPGIIVDR